MTTASPLVSILIPAYHARFFAQALESALSQSYGSIEVVVCDDSVGQEIERIVERAASPRVRYVHNAQRLGFAGNFTQCFQLARGEYIKFLNDDDRLRPQCVATLAHILSGNPNVFLATSRRCVIDAQGAECLDVPATAPVCHVTSLVLGRELGDLVLVNSLNLIGEPTTAMFRKADLTLEGETIFHWGGKDYHCLADLALWLRLLSRGLAYYDASALSEYRVHAGQEQEQGVMPINCLFERLWITQEAHRRGFLATPLLWKRTLDQLHLRATASRDGSRDHPETYALLQRFVVEVETELGAV
jgi:glycosyltransferase involved in cell wall biosynthesis